MNSKPEVPVFFATDDNYAPFLAVTFKSILDNASKDFSYKFYVSYRKSWHNMKKNNSVL